MFTLGYNGFITKAPCTDKVTTTNLQVAWPTQGQTQLGWKYMTVYGNIWETNIVLRVWIDQIEKNYVYI
jgi:hypothetical protein